MILCTAKLAVSSLLILATAGLMNRSVRFSTVAQTHEETLALLASEPTEDLTCNCIEH